MTVFVLAVTVTACGEGRPSYGEWSAKWAEAQTVMPEFTGAPIDRATCSEALGALRTLSADLRTTPDRHALDDVVREWISVAELTMFECPPRERDIDSFEAAYRELGLLEAEVAAVLELAD